jgi:tetratricopeptide (TPR) repeat protein
MFIVLSQFAFAQENCAVQNLVKEGIQLHDSGKFSEAIVKYKEALKIDSNSTVARYELANTLCANKQFEESIENCKYIINLNKDLMDEAYLVWGSCLDIQGNSMASIKIFEEAVKKFPDHSRLIYNLAVTQYSANMYDEAEATVVKSIEQTSLYPRAHLLLSYIMEKKYQKTKAILPLYYFLVLNPKSDLAPSAYKRLKYLLSEGVKVVSDSATTITLHKSIDTSLAFTSIDLFISMMAVSKSSPENKVKSPIQFFAYNTKALFELLSRLKLDAKGVWKNVYCKLFSELYTSDNVEAFSYYISKSTNDQDVNEWIRNNGDKINLLEIWLNHHLVND